MKLVPSTIELRVEKIAHLFDPLDPLPIPCRDLTKNAEEFIVGWARELPRGCPIQIVVHAPEDEVRNFEAKSLKAEFAHHFAARAESVKGDLRELFRIGRLALAIGLTALAACMLGGRAISSLLGEGPLARYFSTGLTILGWVANWRPLEIFLYDWWPLARRSRLYDRLAAAHVEIRSHREAS